MKQWMNKAIVLLLGVFLATSAYAEELSGPRMGFTYLDNKTMTSLKREGIDITASSLIQFGWQFERKFFTTKTGPEGVTELVPLLGGFEQGLLVPSITWLIGLRTRSGFEMGMGPNLSITSTGVAFALGYTNRLGELNIPINLAYVTTEEGGRVSFLFGFNAAVSK